MTIYDMKAYEKPDVLISIAEPGDRVTISDPRSGERSGRVVMARPGGSNHLVLNMGGRYGTPGIATAENIVRLKPKGAR